MTETPQPLRKSFIPAVVALYMLVLAIISGGLAVLSFTGVTAVGVPVAVGLAVLAAALLVDAVGLFMRQRWAYFLTIALNAIYIVVAVLGMFDGGLGTQGILSIVINAVIIAVFFRDAETRAAFGRAG